MKLTADESEAMLMAIADVLLGVGIDGNLGMVDGVTKFAEKLAAAEARIRGLEEALQSFVDVCDFAPPVLFVDRIGKACSVARAARTPEPAPDAVREAAEKVRSHFKPNDVAYTLFGEDVLALLAALDARHGGGEKGGGR